MIFGGVPTILDSCLEGFSQGFHYDWLKLISYLAFKYALCFKSSYSIYEVLPSSFDWLCLLF